MLRRWRVHTARAVLVIAGGVSPSVHAQSRSSTLSVSAVVVPRCSVAAQGTAVSLSCSGHAARTVRTMVAGQHTLPRVRGADPNRLDITWTGLETAEPLLVIDF